MPTTGLDFTGVDQFWHVVDILAKDTEPTEQQWQALLSTPGYRLAQIALGTVVQEDLEVAFRPSRRAAFDSLTALAERSRVPAQASRACSVTAQTARCIPRFSQSLGAHHRGDPHGAAISAAGCDQ